MDEDLGHISAFSILAFVILAVASPFSFQSSMGVAIFLFFMLKFFFGLGNSFEIRDLMITIALFQWIVGPVLKYNYSHVDIFYYMAVPEQTYFSFVLPASMGFIAGLYMPKIHHKLDSNYHLNNINELLKKHPNIDVNILLIGVVAGIAENFMPVSVKFFVYLVGCSRYIGLFFILINNRPHKWKIFTVIVLWLFIASARHAIFHELILWLVFLFIVIAFIFKFNHSKKLIFIIPLFIFIGLIQSVKFYFRQEITAFTDPFAKANLFTEMIAEELVNREKTMSASNLDAAIDRINQGWIVARIMCYTPAYEPFAKGETIITDIQSSLVPRFLAPNKPKAGGRDNFERFTGKKLSENTSMGLGTLGEAYANFGINGGILFLFFLGLFYNVYIHFLIRLSAKYPSLILWLPLLFLQVVKAETDFVVVLNHLVKATIVVAFLIFIIRRFLGAKI